MVASLSSTLADYNKTVSETKGLLDIRKEVIIETNSGKTEEYDPLDSLLERIGGQYQKLKVLSKNLEDAKINLKHSDEKDKDNKKTYRFFQGCTAGSALGNIGILIYTVVKSEKEWEVVAAVATLSILLFVGATGALQTMLSKKEEKEKELKDFTPQEKESLKSLLQALRTWKDAVEEEKVEKQSRGLKQSLEKINKIKQDSLEKLADRDKLVCGLIEQTLPAEHPLHVKLAKIFGEAESPRISPAKQGVVNLTSDEDMGASSGSENMGTILDQFINVIPFEMKKVYYRDKEYTFK